MVQLKQTAKQAAIATAKIIARESSETLKSAKTQFGIESTPQKAEKKEEPKSQEVELNKAKLRNQSVRQVQALEKELEDIQRMKLQRKQEELQQEEMRKQEEARSKETAAPEIQSKKGRRMMGAMKKAKTTVVNLFKSRAQQQVEMRQPPSS